MKKLIWLALFLVGSSSMARTPWVASGGIGLLASPALFLLNLQLETPVKENIWVGPMVQAGLGNAVLMTVSATGRLMIGDHPKIKPSAEAGLGLAVAGAGAGVHISLGMGFDYKLDRSLSLGTFLRANFAPPLTTFFMSWTIFNVRLAL